MTPPEELSLRERYEKTSATLLGTEGEDCSLVVDGWIASGGQSAVFAGKFCSFSRVELMLP
jgi:hypothetical protein